MPTYETPGVYIEEAPALPPSVTPVATAVPAFIGYTEKAVGDGGEDLTGTPVRIASLADYERRFGDAPVQELSVRVTRRAGRGPAGVAVRWAAGPGLPAQLLHYSLRLYFANGGGPCHVYSLGPYGDAAPGDFTDAIAALESVDEVTLLVFPDAVRLTDDGYAAVVDAALSSCRRMKDRFAIADIPDALPGGTEDNAGVTARFRARIGGRSADLTRCGAAYFPYLATTIPFRTADGNVTVDGMKAAAAGMPARAVTPLDDPGLERGAYEAIRAFLSRACVTLPPSGAIAGVYARVDGTRGVWNAPANAALNLVRAPAIEVTDRQQQDLNVDPGAGMSVNVIRAFAGKGTLVWGARTLAGNDNEWRYVNVRRFAGFVEESVGKALAPFALEPNDANTWSRARAMIENFLTLQWRSGALMGGKPEDAFHVAVGLGRTMSPQDVLEGRMIVEMHLAMIRPAEFIVLRLVQAMPEA